MKTLARRFALALGLLFYGHVAWATCSLSAIDIQKSIDQKGAEQALQILANNDFKRWMAFVNCLKTGEKSWMKIAVQFAPYRDGFVGEDMDAYLGMALANNAENVLRIAWPTFNYREFCGMLQTEGPDDPNYYLKDLDSRDRGLDKVKAKDIQPVVSWCHQEIKDTREYILSHPNN